MSSVSLKKQAIRGTVWTVAGYGASQILRLGNNLILSRLLYPELFGLMALVNTFIIGLHLFSDVGIGPSIIRHKSGDDPNFLNTAWTIQVIRSFVIWLCCVLIAGPVAHFYDKPQLLWLIPVVGLSTIIGGFNSTAAITLSRHMVIGQLVVFELGGQIIALAVMNLWAWFSPSIWALVVGGLASSIVQLIWSYNLIPKGSNRFAWDREAAKEIFSFGKWIFLSTAITFLAEQADRLILGKLLSLEMLGVYGVALTFADLPRSVTTALSGKVIFPAVAKIADLPRQAIRAKILQHRLPILLGSAFCLTSLVSFGDLFIKVLYDDRYTDAAWMLPILALGIWPRVLCNLNETSLFAIGKPQYTTCGHLTRFLCTSVGVIFGFVQMGVIGAIVAVALNDLCYYLVVNYGLWREGLDGLTQDLRVTMLLVLLVTAVITSRFMLGFGYPIDQLF